MLDRDYLAKQVKDAEDDWARQHRVKRMWTYEQTTGKLFDPANAFVATGYAGGDEGQHPEGVNNNAMQDVPRVGPLPIGLYRMGEPLMQSHLGPFAIPLIPDPVNDMFGRSGFFCHGDTAEMNQSASEGCMIFPRAIRNQMWESGDNQVSVVEYVQAATDSVS